MSHESVEGALLCQKEMEVVVGALHIPDNNNSLKTKTKIFHKNRIVILSEKAQIRCLEEEKQLLFPEIECFSSFRRFCMPHEFDVKGILRWTEEEIPFRPKVVAGFAGF